MRIAMIGQKGMPATYGGVERHVHDLSTALSKLNHEVTVYSRSWYTKKSGDISIDGVKVKHLPTIKTKHLDTLSHVLIATLHALTQKYDVIHYHGVGPALVSWIPRLFARNTKIITTFHSIDRYHQKWGIIAKWILRAGEAAAVYFAHTTITVSRSLQLYCLNEFERDTDYIPTGIKKTGDKPESGILAQLGLKNNTYILMVARLVPHKGAHILISAFIDLTLNATDPDLKNLKLVIVGGSVYTNDYVQELHTQASVCNNIIFTDFQCGADLESLYQNAKAVVHPSLNEGLPITVLEAMNFSKPVLLSNIPEHLELIDNPSAIFNQNDPDDLKLKLKKIFSLSSEELQTMGERNFKTIEENYRWDTIVPKIERVYSAPVVKSTISEAPSKSISEV